MPRRSTVMSPQRIARAQSMRANGYTTGEIADALGVSTSTLSKSLE
jgi:orotate phosphoribosyltransferase-like protein